MDTKIIQNKLLEWYKKEGRHHLPWRNTKELYHIYLSEVMLQQTQVNRVLEEYYPNFLKKFPTLETLAMANEEDVIVAWSGLGYYSRARNLHKTAKLCYKNFPKRFEELIKLPGIGKYTASAICAFGYKQSVTVLDTNIKRVIKRLFAIEVEDEKIIDQKAYTVLNEKSPREHNLALMDLGSMVCVPKNPKCEGCPLEPFCLGKNDIQRYTKTKKTRYEKLDLFLGIWIKNNKIALKKSTTNMYKNMLVLPEIEPIEENFITDFKHAYTKYNITVHLYRIEEYVEDVIWVDVDDIHNQPIASLTSKAIDRYRKKFVNSSNEHFYSHDVINLNFKNLLKLNNIELRTLYNLRHTFASQMISSGADIVWVSKMLGHKDVSITLKVYTKFIQENENKRFKKIEQMGTIMGTVSSLIS